LILKHFSFYKKQNSSAASRNIYHFYNKWNISNKLKILDQLSFKKKNLSGRGCKGSIILRTKSSLLIKKKFIKINYNFRYIRMGSLLSFTFIPFKNKVLSLIFFNNGSFTYHLSSNSQKLFSFIYFKNVNFKKLKKLKLKTFYLMLFQLKKLSFVSCLELLPGKGSQYSRSPGTKSRIIKFDKSTHTVLIELSSKIKKIFSFYSFVMKSSIVLNLHKKILNGKAGYWRSFGIKPIVRGVAMNAVDHPNGGRTKSLKYPKTPWGKTTKYK